MKKVFVGPNGIRAGWRFLIFAAICVGLSAGFTYVIDNVFHYKESRTWVATDLLLAEAFGSLGIVTTLIAAAVMSRIEKRRMGEYGLPLRNGIGRKFGAGIVWGFLSVALVFGLIWAAGGVTISGLALQGGALAKSAVLWGITMLTLGLAEEFMFRGYPQFTFATGIGFWPAGTLISLLFGGLHYFGKGNLETVADGLSVTLLAFFILFTLRRTGDLWFAVGWHAAFDYAALVVAGAPNTGNNAEPIHDRLLATTFQGPAWKTGGPSGLEASWLIFPVIALMFFLFHRLYPVRSLATSKE
jgi:membrane protease YdiL (CAAX protease family)